MRKQDNLTQQINNSKSVNVEKLSLKTKIGYGMGDIYGGGSWMIIGIYYLYFLTSVLKINPALAGLVILVSKLWDALSDPLMGIISDRTRTKYGRRRPYFLVGTVLIFLSFFLLWYPVDFSSEMKRFAFAMFAYLFFCTVITMVMIPYNALASELTLDYNERTSLTSVRMFFSMFSSVLCAVLPLEIIKRFENVKAGHIVMASSFGLLFALPFIATFLTTRERQEFQQRLSKFNFKESFIIPFKNRSFRMVLFMYLFAFLAMDVIMAILMYFMTYYLGKGNQTNFVMGMLLIVQIVVIPIYSMMGKKWGKRKAFSMAVTLWLVAMIGSFLISPKTASFGIYLFAGIVGAATGGVVVMIYSIFTDIPDVDELQSGSRREGLFSGLYTFMRKLSSALAVFIISNIIAIAGYKPPIEEVIDGNVRIVQQAQSPEFILTLRLVFATIPIALLAFCLWAALKYPLTPESHAKLKKILEATRKNQIDQELMQEKLKLKKILIGE
ncbi:MAG: MFS transporter [Pseudothermotoga sp.]